MKKSSLSLIMSGVLLFSFFCVSCGKSKSRPSNPDTKLKLALRSGTYSDVIKKVIRTFEIENNVWCEIYEFSEDELHKKVLEAGNQANREFDFLMVDSSWIAECMSHNILTNLSELGYNLDSDIITATKSVCYKNGSVYLAPFYGNVTVLMFNKVILREAGYTEETIRTLDDIVDICMYSKSRHNLGFMYRGDTPNNIVVDFLPILRACGGWVVDENNYPTVNTPEFYKALNYYLSMIHTGTSAKKEDLVMAIANSSAALGIGWPGWYKPSEKEPLDYTSFVGRCSENQVRYNSNIYGIWTVGIPENSRNKIIAVKLLEYIMNPDVQKSTIPSGGVPCRYSSLSDPKVLAKYPQYEAVLSALENGIYRPVMEEWTQFYTVLGNELKMIFDGRLSIEEGLEEAQEKLENLLK